MLNNRHIELSVKWSSYALLLIAGTLAPSGLQAQSFDPYAQYDSQMTQVKQYLGAALLPELKTMRCDLSDLDESSEIVAKKVQLNLTQLYTNKLDLDETLDTQSQHLDKEMTAFYVPAPSDYKIAGGKEQPLYHEFEMRVKLNGSPLQSRSYSLMSCKVNELTVDEYAVFYKEVLSYSDPLDQRRQQQFTDQRRAGEVPGTMIGQGNDPGAIYPQGPEQLLKPLSQSVNGELQGATRMFYNVLNETLIEAPKNMIRNFFGGTPQGEADVDSNEMLRQQALREMQRSGTWDR